MSLSSPPYTVALHQVEGRTFAVITAANLQSGGPAGAPALPAVSARVVVPPQAQVSLELVSVHEVIAPLPVLPQPLPRLEANGWTPEQPGAPTVVYEPDPAYYQASGTYPSDLCTITADEWVREWRLLEVRCTPWRYRPADNALIVAETAELRLLFSGPVPASTSLSALSGDPMAQVIASSVLNPEDLGSFRQKFTAATSALALPEPVGRYRLLITQGTGIYAISYDELLAAGVPITGIESRSLRLFSAGQEVAIEVEDADGIFGPGDRILFFGEERQSPYGTANAYWLDWGGPEGMRVTSRASAPTNSGSAVPLTATVALRNYDPRYPDPWRSNWTDLYNYEPSYSPIAEDGHFFPGIVQVMAPQDMPDREWFAADLAAANGQATLTIALQGITDGQHRVDVEFAPGSAGGPFATYLPLTLDAMTATTSVHSLARPEPTYTSLGSITWSGATIATQQFQVQVAAGLQVLRLSLPGQPNGQGGYLAERAYVGPPTLQYPLARATAGAALVEGKAGYATYRLAGFPSANIIVWDVTAPGSPVAITGGQANSLGASWEIVFADDVSSAAVYALADKSILKRVAAIIQPEAVTLAPAAQYLIITHPDFLVAAQVIAQHRQVKSGLSTRIVTTQTIYDRFSFGLLDPEAIRSFVAEAYNSWLNPDGSHLLRYLLLIGDGSYDFENRLRHGEANFLPPYLVENVDPNWKGQAGTDHVYANARQTPPSVLVGRIPVRTLAEASVVVQKIISYENGEPNTWAAKALFTADDPDRRDYGSGETEFAFDVVANEAIQATTGTGRIPAANVSRVYQSASVTSAPGYYYNDGDEDTAALLAQWRSGQLITYYAGHSHFWGWGFPKLFNTDDIPSMGATPSTVLVAMTCFTGAFYHPKNASLDEALLLPSNHGIVASFSPLSMGSAAGHEIMQRPLLESVLQGATVGEALLAGKLALDYSYRDLVDTYAVLGDPALRLAGVPSGTQFSTMLPLILRTGS